MEIFGIRFIGINSENGRKLLLTLAFIVVYLIFRYGLNALVKVLMRGRQNERTRFWIHQGVSLTFALLMILVVVSIWFDDPERLTTALGFVTAGLAFALQRVITSIAAYFMILRGRVFTVGDRILMSGVRGDVIALNFTQTTIMEMGQPPGERPDDPNVWVKSRQFTGRIVTVTNDKIFENPVFNYTREFPYIWEEMTIPIKYTGNRERAEEIILEAAKRHTVEIGEMSEEALEKMQKRYYVVKADLKPKVYYRLTDNWLELTVRFLAREHGTRQLKDNMSREILTAFDAEKIEIASATFEVVGLPPLHFDGAAKTES